MVQVDCINVLSKYNVLQYETATHQRKEHPRFNGKSLVTGSSLSKLLLESSISYTSPSEVCIVLQLDYLLQAIVLKPSTQIADPTAANLPSTTTKYVTQ